MARQLTADYDAFNPAVRDTQDPDWTNASRGFSPVHLISADASTIEAAGKIGAGAIKVADQAVETYAGEQAKKIFEPAKDEYISYLQGKEGVVRLAALGAGTPGAGSATGTPGGLPGDNPNPDGQPLPAELKRLPGTLGVLDGARGNGKLTESDYYARLMTLAKDLRSRFPVGYHDYIDEQVSKITGVNPANAYMKSLIGDINSFVAGQKDYKDKVLSKMLENIKLPGMNGMIDGVMGGTTSISEALAFMNDKLSRTYRMEVDGQALALSDKTNESKAKDAEHLANTIGDQHITDLFDVMLKKSGTNAKNISDVFNNLDPKALVPFTAGFNSAINDAAVQFTNKLKQPMTDPNTGAIIIDKITGKPATIASFMAPGKPEEIIEAKLKLARQYVTDVNNKDFGAANINAIMFQKMKDERQMKMAGDPSMEKWLLDMSIIHTAVGSQAMSGLVVDYLSDFQKDWGMWANNSRNNSISMQPDRNTGVPPSMQRDFETYRKNGGTDGTAYFRMVDWIERIADPKIPPAARAKMVQYAFAPENYGLLARMNADGINPVTGAKEPGKFSTFARWGKDDMISSVKELGPDAWATYKTWALTTQNSDLMKPLLQQINSVKKSDQVALTWHSDSMRWGVDVGRFKDLNLNPSAANFEPAASAKSYFTPINNLNTSLDVVSRILKADGASKDEINGALISTMIHLGLDPDISRIGGVPKEIQDAIGAHREQTKGTNKAKEDLFSIPTAPGVVPPPAPAPEVPYDEPVIPLRPTKQIKMNRDVEREVQPGRIPLR